MVTVNTNVPAPELVFFPNPPAYADLCNEIEFFVLNDQFEQLRDLLHSCSSGQLTALKQNKILDHLVETILVTPSLSDIEGERAYQLALEMERVGISPIWAKIARTLISLRPGREVNFDVLINQMIAHDKQPHTSLEHRAELLYLADKYVLEGNHEMHNKIKEILNEYNQLTVGLIQPLSSDLLSLLGLYLFV